MADAVTVQLLENGPRVWAYSFTNLSDGTGESGVVKVDGSATGPLGVNVGGQTFFPLQHIKIIEIEYDVKGMALEIIWDANRRRMRWCSAASARCIFTRFGGLAAPSGRLWRVACRRHGQDFVHHARGDAELRVHRVYAGGRRVRRRAEGEAHSMRKHFRTIAIAASAALIAASLVAWAAQTNYLGTVFIADLPPTPSQQLEVNADGSINASNTSAAPLYVAGNWRARHRTKSKPLTPAKRFAHGGPVGRRPVHDSPMLRVAGGWGACSASTISTIMSVGGDPAPLQVSRGLGSQADQLQLRLHGQLSPPMRTVSVRRAARWAL